MQKKSLLTVFLVTLVVGGLVLVSSFNHSFVQAATEFGGIISSDATWTKANSPYILTGNVLVNHGVTLTIAPGVTVNLDSYYIMINGTLNARGNNTNPITFNANPSTDPSSNEGQIIFTQSSIGWNDSTSTGSIIENAVVYPTLTLESSLKINNDTISGLIDIQTTKGTSIILNNTIKGGINVGPWGTGYSNAVSATISNNNIMNGRVIITLPDTGNITVSGNVISGYGLLTANFWWYSGTLVPLIENNLIINSTTQLQIILLEFTFPMLSYLPELVHHTHSTRLFRTTIFMATPIIMLTIKTQVI